jgi:hypothetical protein
MIEKEQENLHFILHDSPEPPRLLVISKRTLGRFTVVLPLTIAGIFVALIALAWMRAPSMTGQLKNLELPKMPRLNESGKVKELESELAGLKLATAAIQNKLSEGINAESDLWLGPVKRPYALQDLTAKKLLRMEELSLESDANRQVLRFNLVNAGSDSLKVMGHIFVLQIHQQGMGIYPVSSAEDLMLGLRYNLGESFSVSRLRPVEAPFPAAANAHYLVIIFNREGDLLVREELKGPFKRVGGQ